MLFMAKDRRKREIIGKEETARHFCDLLWHLSSFSLSLAIFSGPSTLFLVSRLILIKISKRILEILQIYIYFGKKLSFFSKALHLLHLFDDCRFAGFTSSQ